MRLQPMIFSRLKRILKTNKPSQRLVGDRGFTLVELLVTALVASGILSGLLFLTNELLRSDERESNRTETQRDMQLALDFISSELREAIYIYEADCLDGTDPECPGLTTANGNNLGLPNDYIPVLAFWKLEPLPENVKNDCAGVNAAGEALANPPDISNKIFCLAGNYYSLIVYSIGFPDAANGYDAIETDTAAPLDFRGRAALFRSAMVIEDKDADGYISPLESQKPRFRSWPSTDANPDVWPSTDAPVFETRALIDFVDDGANDPAALDDTLLCDVDGDGSPNPEYVVTPTGNVPRSFYACVNTNRLTDVEDNTSGTYFGNQDVILYLRGNAAGRSGLMTGNSFLPTLESRVFVRGAIDRP
ncbi:MAG: prepilin-type N-terminal cleavage/methylation domain-containing protein [Synechococcales bacterium]|nr:prepilin-type N-terminal cleavage/methylation domain-containing protein [Synechococcales bacterium]